MAEHTPDAPDAATSDVAESGSYEVLQRRLRGHADALESVARALNEQRVERFGSVSWEVLGQDRLRTEHANLPRDMVQVGGRLLVGYNVFLGLKQQTSPDDVFGLYAIEREGDVPTFRAVPSEARAFLSGPAFQREFTELFQYYANARLTQLRRVEGKLLAVFQTGDRVDDVKVLRWNVAPGGDTTYLDNRGERDHVFPPAHDFTWTPASRDMHVRGRHPHINILDTVFVETVGGDLTIKVEDNTESGEGLYAEPVDDPNQSLDDASISFARLGALVLLKVRPFNEERTRGLVFIETTRAVLRVDPIVDSCVTLPEDHGILFPGGYVLRDGEHKTFDAEHKGMRFVRRIDAPNGEDVLYVFHRAHDGLYALYPYNLIRKEVRAPLHAHGWSLFSDGTLAVLRAQAEPTRVHPVQLWRTPFVDPEHVDTTTQGDDLLARVGNAELVRGISDALTLVRLARNPVPTQAAFDDLATSCQRFLDAYYWASEATVGDLAAPVHEVLRTTELVVDEFDKVQALRRRAKEVVAEARTAHRKLLDQVRPERLDRVQDFLDAMTAVRRHRGHLVTLQDTRYVDRPALVALEEEAAARFDALGRATVSFLEGDDAFVPLRDGLDRIAADLEGLERAVDLAPVRERLESTSTGVDLLAEVVAGLEVEDPTRKTALLDRIGEVFSHTNQVRAALEAREAALREREGSAAFAAQLKLLGQAVQSALARCNTPEACDEQLSRLLLQVEELEGRFGEFDAFLPQLAQQREEVHTAFAARRQRLVDERNKRIEARMSAADRILEGLARRARTQADEDSLNSYFAADPMVGKLRTLADELEALGDTVRAEELRGRLRRTRQDALRGLRDKLELFDDDNLVQLGRHKFTVNTQPFELALVPDGERMVLTLTGTRFRQPVEDPELLAARPYWEQTLVSETDAVYRAEYLAHRIVRDAEAGRSGLSIAALEKAHASEDDLLALVRTQTAEAWDEGYDRGVHDVDAARILGALLTLRRAAGLQRFPAPARALAMLFRAFAVEAPWEAWRARAVSLVRLREEIGPTPRLAAFAATLAGAVASFHATSGFDTDGSLIEVFAGQAGAYLVEVLASEPVRFVVSQDAEALRQRLDRWLDDHEGRQAFGDRTRRLADRPAELLDVLVAWLEAVAEPSADVPLHEVAFEAGAWMVCDRRVDAAPEAGTARATLPGMLGRHPRIVDGTLTLSLSAFLARLDAFRAERVPGFRAWRETRHTVLSRWRRALRLDELEPRVMSAFVRNKLIQDVYLPLIGDNFAKQMGAAGDAKRTDLMGLLLLVSPPGYGKTTLMEYVAHRLGLVFVKVNGPALGHGVTSLDPEEAPNATARQEVDKINLALELGDNVLLYLDDIQHTNPELLQKFISLCDASRRIEGVWQGRTRTYDLRGRKFAVVMAGNPYTESGDKFQVPDMLANRADTYNLGDVLSGREEQFALSFIENALTSNPVLQPLAARAQADVYALVRMAQGEELPPSALKHDYTAVERGEILAVLRHLFAARNLLLKVNAEYVRSAAMEDRFRTEPRFQLQGSYRNMAKIGEKVVAAMTPDELQELLSDHYRGEAQTLTTGAEYNLLRLAELRGRLTDEEAERLKGLRDEFRRLQLVGGGDDDPATRVAGVLSGLVEAVGRLGQGVGDPAVPEALRALDGRLASVQQAIVSGSGAADRLGDVSNALRAVYKRLGERPAPDLATLAEPLARIADRMAQTAPAAGSSAPGDDALKDVMAEVRSLREAMRPASPPSIDQDARRARLLDQARRAVAGDLRRVDDGGDPNLAAALSVIELLTVHMASAAKSFLPAEHHDAWQQEIRRAVATALADLAARAERSAVAEE